MAGTTLLEDYITENELMSKFGLKASIINLAGKKHTLLILVIKTY